MLIDVTRVAGRRAKGRLPTGVDRVCLAYIARYRSSAQAMFQRGSRVHVVPPTDSQRLFDWLVGDQPVSWAGLATYLARAVAGGGSPRVKGMLVFNVGHSGLERPGYAQALQLRGLRPVFMVHDLIPIEFPEYCRPGEAERHARRMLTVLDCASGIVTNSRYTLERLDTFARRVGRSVPRAVAAHLGVEPTFCRGRGALSDPPYFVMLGTIEPRKNHLLILQVWRRLVEQFGEAAPHLVLIGQRGWECENAVDLLERCPVLQGRVTELSGCSDTELARWISGAQAMLFPSFAEGYGLPLVEALVSGVPVLASDLPVFREISGDRPVYLDPLDGPAWAEAIMRYARPHPASGGVTPSASLANYSRPTWDAHFTLVDRLIEEIGGAG